MRFFLTASEYSLGPYGKKQLFVNAAAALMLASMKQLFVNASTDDAALTMLRARP